MRRTRGSKEGTEWGKNLRTVETNLLMKNKKEKKMKNI